MKTYSYYQIVFHLALICSCNYEKNQIDGLLIATDEIKIKVHDKSPNVFDFIQIVDINGKEHIMCQNKNSNGIDFYDLKSGALVNQINLNPTGPLGINEIDGIIFHNPDSIFVMSRRSIRNILLVNYEGEIVSNFSFTQLPFLSHASFSRMPSYFIDGSIYCLVAPFIDFSQKGVYQNNIPLEYKLDLINNTIDTIPVSYPEKYKTGNWGITHAIPCRIFNGESFVYSFGIEADLITFNLNYCTKSKFTAKSAKHKKTITPIRANQNNLSYLIETDYYGDIYFDKYRKVYYRLFRQGSPSKTKIGKPEIWENKPASIMILSDKFEILGETELKPISNFYPRDILIGREGLYISNNHPSSPKNEEDFMRFTLFKLQQEL